MQQVSISPAMPLITPQQDENKNSSNKPGFLENIPDGNKKIAAGLAALAAAAVAGIAIYKGKSPAQTAETAANIVKDAASNNRIVKTTEEIAQNAKDSIIKGENYQTIRKEAMKNASHSDKKKIKEMIHQGVSIRNQARKEAVQQNISLSKTNEKMSQIVEKASQGIKSAVSAEELTARQQTAETAAKKAQEIADGLASTAKTHREVKYAKQAQTTANEAKLKAQRVVKKAQNKIDELEAAAIQKAKNVETLKQSPNYEAGLEKQAKNAQKTTRNAANRMYKREYNKIAGKYSNAPVQKLQAMLDHGRYSSEFEKSVIENIINSRR